MNVLGISGRYREAAAALAIDGQVRAGASEDSFVRVSGIGYQQTGGFPQAAVDACLRSAGLTIQDVDEVAVVDDGPSDEVADASSAKGRPSWIPAEAGLRWRSMARVDPIQADAEQAAVAADDVATVLVCSTQPSVFADFVRDGDRLVPGPGISGAERLMMAARALTSGLGVGAGDPYRALDRLSVGGDPEFVGELAEAIRWEPANGVVTDLDRISDLVRAVSGADNTLADASSLNVRVQEARRALATSFTHRLASVVSETLESMRAAGRSPTIAVGGSMFANPTFNTELRRLAGDRVVASGVPEPAGRALGAALSTPGQSERLSRLALGPAFSDHDIKRSLDNCRLDYVYEPDWHRLLVRASKMLSQGKVVAWFQGPMAFGPRPLGSRSVLCDPSGRYARQNLNEFLRHCPLDEPLPVVFAPTAAEHCLLEPVSSAPTLVDVAVKPECRGRLVAALDRRQQVRVQPMGPAQAPELCDLLEVHAEMSGVPALIETNLGGFGEPIACTPRDAVRTVYSSAIDALVIGHFLLMKDYWLLRSDGA